MDLPRASAYRGVVPDLFDVIADPTRRELLAALLEEAEVRATGGEVSVGVLVAKLGLSQPTVSKHLKTLRELRVVSVREEGQRRFYRLEPGSLDPVAAWLGAFVRPTASPAPDHPDPVDAVAGAVPGRPLPPRARAVAIRLGGAAAGVAGRLRRR